MCLGGLLGPHSLMTRAGPLSLYDPRLPLPALVSAGCEPGKQEILGSAHPGWASALRMYSVSSVVKLALICPY